MQKYETNSEEETKKFAEGLVVRFTHHKPLIIALSGDLGAGKTIFTQGFAKGLRIKEKIISPTFILIRQHQIPNTKKILYHIDLYRLENTRSLKELGLEEIWSDPNNIVLIEWAEKLEKLPAGTIKISIQKGESNERNIIIS